jgi:hypothetical protein
MVGASDAKLCSVQNRHRSALLLVDRFTRSRPLALQNNQVMGLYTWQKIPLSGMGKSIVGRASGAHPNPIVVQLLLPVNSHVARKEPELRGSRDALSRHWARIDPVTRRQRAIANSATERERESLAAGSTLTLKKSLSRPRRFSSAPEAAMADALRAPHFFWNVRASAERQCSLATFVHRESTQKTSQDYFQIWPASGSRTLLVR